MNSIPQELVMAILDFAGLQATVKYMCVNKQTYKRFKYILITVMQLKKTIIRWNNSARFSYGYRKPPHPNWPIYDYNIIFMLCKKMSENVIAFSKNKYKTIMDIHILILKYNFYTRESAGNFFLANKDPKFSIECHVKTHIERIIHKEKIK
jgi:hypothetical protein